jgi:flagellar basal-body rod protein FlgG
MRALNTAATGMQAQQLNVEVIANNIANMNTTGFKRQRAEFQDLLYQNVERMGVTSSDQGTIVPTGVQVGVGVKAGSVYRVTEQGGMTQTTNPYDVGISGRRLFHHPAAGWPRRLYARRQLRAVAGWTAGDRRRLHSGAGHLGAAGRGGRFDQPPGRRAGDHGRRQRPQDVGALELARFVNPAGLEAIGDNSFVETPARARRTAGNRLRSASATCSRAFSKRRTSTR